MGLWTDIPLADLEGERARNWRQWAQSEHVIPGHDLLLQALSALGRHNEVLHRLDDLPVEQQQNLMLVKRRLEALHGLARAKEALTHYLTMRKRLKDDFDDEAADALKTFYDNLVTVSPAHGPTPAPPSATKPVPHLLPHDISDFTGREALLSQLDATTTTSGHSDTRLVVLSGPPGVGKTALAVHWAHRTATNFPGGRLYADLGGFADGPGVEPTTVVDRFLTALGFPVERLPTAEARAAKLRSLLSGRRMLTILDNANNSRHALSLLDCLSTCFVVVTSRRRLIGLIRRGAVALTLTPLGFHEARTWLARWVGERTAQEPDALAELAALCNGSPLALRGVADHVAARPQVGLGEFVDELRDTDVLLGLGGEDDGSEVSIRTVYSWSYLALPAAEQRMFRLLGLHSGPDIGLDAAAALAGQDRTSTQRLLDGLVTAHLLNQPESRTRYRFHDLLRKYAAECSTVPEHQAERHDAEGRMLSFYLHSANNADAAIFPYRRRVPMLPVVNGVTPLSFTDDALAIDWCERERANLNAIVRRAGETGAHEYAFRLPSVTGEIFQRLGYYEDVFSSLTIAVNSAQVVGDLQGEAYTLNNIGVIHLNLRDFVSAESKFRTAKDRFDQIGFSFGSAAVSHNLARLQVERGEVSAGIEAHIAALAALRQAGADSREVDSMYFLAEAYRRAGNLTAAESYARDALWLASKLGDVSGEGSSLTELGAILYERGNPTSSKEYLVRGLELNNKIRATGAVSKALNVLACVHRDEGDLVGAERCARIALECCRDVRDSRGQATAWALLGQLFQGQAQYDTAAHALAAALAIFEDLGDDQAEVIRARLADLPASPLDLPTTRTEPTVPRRSSRMDATPHHRRSG
jgi:tetratricopeptide (TPR) repeat protein